MEIKENHFCGHKCLGTHIAWAVSKQLGFNTDHENICPFPFHVGSSVQIFRNMYLHLILWGKLSYNFLYKIHYIYMSIKYIKTAIKISFSFFTLQYLKSETRWKRFHQKKLPYFWN